MELKKYGAILSKTRLIDATFDDLRMFLEEFIDEHPMDAPRERQFVRGLKGIMEIFKCGKTKAVELKRDVIADAVQEYGDIILTDRDKAIELFNNYKLKKHKAK